MLRGTTWAIDDLFKKIIPTIFPFSKLSGRGNSIENSIQIKRNVKNSDCIEFLIDEL